MRENEVGPNHGHKNGSTYCDLLRMSSVHYVRSYISNEKICNKKESLKNIFNAINANRTFI